MYRFMWVISRFLTCSLGTCTPASHAELVALAMTSTLRMRTASESSCSVLILLSSCRSVSEPFVKTKAFTPSS